MAVEFYGDLSDPMAIVIRSAEKVASIDFFSPANFSQQIGLMSRPKGHLVLPHMHNEIERIVSQTQEVLVIRSGICRVSLFSLSFTLTDEIILSAGDAILLASGGHGIEMLSDCEILEIKQGPYLGINDKNRLQ